MKAEIFNCELKHGNTSTTVHTIPKVGVTGREMVLLKAIHGEESLLNIKPAGHKEIDEKQELLLLARRYANTQDPYSGKKLVERVFSTSLHDFDKWLEEQVELEQMEREERMERSRAASAAAQATALAAAQAAVAT